MSNNAMNIPRHMLANANTLAVVAIDAASTGPLGCAASALALAVAALMGLSARQRRWRRVRFEHRPGCRLRRSLTDRGAACRVCRLRRPDTPEPEPAERSW